MSNAKYPYQGDFKYLDENGWPECPGDDVCPGPCDESCPIVASEKACELYLEHGDYQVARDLLMKAIVRIPDELYPAAWHLLGNINLRMGYYTSADNCYRAAYDIDRSCKEALVGGLITSACLNRFDQAEIICKHYVEEFGEDDYFIKTRERYLERKEWYMKQGGKQE